MDYTKFFNHLSNTDLARWLDRLPKQAEQGFNIERWGDLPKWQKAIEQLPDVKPAHIDLNSRAITIGTASDVDNDTRETMEKVLMELHPWRKGPFNLFGTDIETEWRSDLKWDRLEGHISSLNDRLILDVGCGSGYHCWRMRGAGAKLVMGIDPTLLYVMQFLAFQKYVQDSRVAVLPLGIDDIPSEVSGFDTIFSMGLLYHRRSPFDHLLQLYSLLRDEGELVLETLVIDGKEGEVLTPQGRYAKMPNVWFIPSVSTLETWLKKMKFDHVRCVDVTTTTSEEQRVTPWMGFQSLADFLDPNDSSKTAEGYPALRRAILLANKGGN